MADSHSEMERVLGKLAYGVYVVGVLSEGTLNAFTASWVMRAGTSPPLLAVAIAKSRPSNQTIRETGVFSVSILGKGRTDLAERFAIPFREGKSKFIGEPFSLTAYKVPVLADSIGYMICQLVRVFNTEGDHDVFLGRIIEAVDVSEENPLLLADSGLELRMQ